MTDNTPPSIMVVDDTPENLRVLKQILAAEQYEVRPLSNGEMALRAARAEAPDLILLDIMMPGMDGYEVCARLKGDPVTREAPVIFISALHDADDKVRAFSAGGVDYVSKPFQVEEVLARVSTHLRLSAMQRALRQQNERLQEAAALFEVSSDGIILTDARSVILRVNPAFTEITGYSAGEAIGQTPRMLKSGHHPPEFYARMWRDLLNKGFWEGEIWNRRKNDSFYPQWERITAIRDEQGAVAGYVAQLSDIARRKLTEQEIRNRGNYDALTGLVSRSLLLERLELAIREHRRNGCKLCVLIIGLDRFKQINDAVGHAAGDTLLRQAGDRLKAEIRDIDTAARVGGDEFVLMLIDQTDQTSVERLVRRLLEQLERPFALPAGDADIGASIGISVFPDDGDNADVLLRNAGIAMSRAKESGGRRFRFFTEAMEQELRERYRLEVELKQAAERGELAVYYQPIVDLSSGRPRGVESLLRWHHPTLGAVSPATFIPIAESSDLIHAIGAWVLSTVCRQLRAWQRQGLALYASVNVSARQIPHGLNPAWLRRLTDEMDLTPDQLVLEVTESVFVEDVEPVAEWLRRVRGEDFKVYLDDFGTGYSSLSYLKNFPVDAVKIDQVFVRDMVEQPRDLALVRAIIAMSEGLGLQVVAEGVETEAQRRLLRDLNCAFGQGYLFSKPLPPEELETVTWPSKKQQRNDGI